MAAILLACGVAGAPTGHISVPVVGGKEMGAEL
jgi:hypothetical protein